MEFDKTGWSCPCNSDQNSARQSWGAGGVGFKVWGVLGCEVGGGSWGGEVGGSRGRWGG